MQTVKFSADEVYPVYLPAEDQDFGDGLTFTADTMELPDDLADRFHRLSDEFWAMQREVKAYRKAVYRDEHADDQVKAVNQARLERGRKRPYRRSRPSGSATTERTT